MKWSLAAAALLAFFVSGVAPAAAQLLSNRAIYELSLERTTGGVVTARGRMATEFRDTCDGWSTTQRMIADMTDSGGAASRTDFSVSSWESKDGRTMRFDIVESNGGKAGKHQRGSATLSPDGAGSVILAEGSPKTFALPRGTQFPTAQILALLRAAATGKTSFRHVIFQGGAPANLNFSTAVIGKSADDEQLSADRAADRYGLVKRVRAWTVLVSFFPLTSRAEFPDYEVATHLFANGVNGSMSLVYPDYTLRATLVRLEPLIPSC
jgi:hypothetical protein